MVDAGWCGCLVRLAAAAATRASGAHASAGGERNAGEEGEEARGGEPFMRVPAGCLTSLSDVALEPLHGGRGAIGRRGCIVT